jgi:hypothetical protein
MALFQKKRKFPLLASILLIFGLTWMLNDMNIISINIPWIPTIIVLVAIGMIFNRFNE